MIGKSFGLFGGKVETLMDIVEISLFKSRLPRLVSTTSPYIVRY